MKDYKGQNAEKSINIRSLEHDSKNVQENYF